MSDLVVTGPAAGALDPLDRRSHTLGNGVDDWQAIEVWLKTVKSNSRNRSTATVDTYRFHLAKLRWFCERVIGRTPISILRPCFRASCSVSPMRASGGSIYSA